MKETTTPSVKTRPCSTTLRRSAPACCTKPMILRPITGNTQGIRLRISPPNSMPPSTRRYLQNGSGFRLCRGSGCAPMSTSGTATGRDPVRTPENASPCGMSLSSASLVARGRRINHASPSRWIDPPELADFTNGWSGTKSVGSPSNAPSGTTRRRMSPPSGVASKDQPSAAAGWLARAAANTSATAGSGVGRRADR